MLPITLWGGNGAVMSPGPPTLRWKSDNCVKVWPRTVTVGPGLGVSRVWASARPEMIPAAAHTISAVVSFVMVRVLRQEAYDNSERGNSEFRSTLNCGACREQPLEAFRRERPLTHAHAGGVEDRVAH